MTPKPCFLTLASALHSRTCAQNLARRFAVKHPPYPTKPTTARAVDGARFEQARQILARRFAASNTPNPTKPTSASYTFPVTSKKGVMGFGSLKKICDESRSHRTGSAAFSLAPPFFGGSDGRAHALPVFARSSRSSNPFEPPPPFGSGCVGFCKPKILEAIHG